MCRHNFPSLHVTDGDLHPTNKAPIGARLALGARALAYGEKIEYLGPIFAAAKREGDKLTVSFTHGAGLYANADKPGTLYDLYLVNEDATYTLATASIEGDKLVADVKDANLSTRLAAESAGEPVQRRQATRRAV